ncbi:MAG: hypothetical protein ACTSRI_20335 [Promethearchaeota archaeon]
MVIKKRKSIIIVSVGLLILICLLNVNRLYKININDTNSELSCQNTFTNNTPMASDSQLPDKVHTFLAPGDNLTFSISLKKGFYYYISVEIVTPHNCTMKINILDPDDCNFNILDNNMSYYPSGLRAFEIPFGTSMSGNHLFNFFVEAVKTLNIHVKIEEGPHCIYNWVAPLENNSFILDDYWRFESGTTIIQEIVLETDVMYYFYIYRTSAITIFEDNIVRMNYFLKDKNQVEFIIYVNEILADIDGFTKFAFGTAVGGVYTLNLTIWCEVDHVNIGQAIVNEYKISEEIPFHDNTTDTSANDTSPEANNTDPFRDLWNSTISLPMEWTIGTLIFVGGTMESLTFLVFTRRKKNAVHLNL